MLLLFNVTIFALSIFFFIAPVTLDPNTAAPWQILSEDLTSVRYTKPQQLPGNPERFSHYEMVLGGRGLGAGVHSWEVEVGGNTDWGLGVASASVERKRDVALRPQEGLWSIGLFLGRYAAYTAPATPLPVRGRLQRVRVELDWDGGTVAFWNAADGTALHTFTQRFSEAVFPCFLTGCRHHGLKVLPAHVSVTREPHTHTPAEPHTHATHTPAEPHTHQPHTHASHTHTPAESHTPHTHTHQLRACSF